MAVVSVYAAVIVGQRTKDTHTSQTQTVFVIKASFCVLCDVRCTLLEHRRHYCFDFGLLKLRALDVSEIPQFLQRGQKNLLNPDPPSYVCSWWGSIFATSGDPDCGLGMESRQEFPSRSRKLVAETRRRRLMRSCCLCVAFFCRTFLLLCCCRFAPMNMGLKELLCFVPS